MWVHALADSDASCGGKAVGLARLIAAGLHVPEGFVIDDRAFSSVVGELPTGAETTIDAIGHGLEAVAARIAHAELPAELVAEVESRAAQLGTLAVRSSASIEDGSAGAAAGVFSSSVDVAVENVWPAIRAVWTSALAPLAAAYARRRGGLAMAVIVQRFVAGERVTVYTRPPGTPLGDAVWVQRGERVEKFRRESANPLVELALEVERAIDAPAGADVELVAGDDLWIVQARPIVHPAPRRRAPPVTVIAPLADGRVWTWDVAHNPDPLSTAQLGLVERVEQAQIAPWSLRVCGGYLYSAARESPAVPAVADRAALEARAAQIEAAIAPFVTGVASSLTEALERYVGFYKIWASDLVPMIRAARVWLAPELLHGARPSAVEMTLLAAARDELDEQAVIAQLGVMAPAWDVAVPTFAERPQVIRDAIARARSMYAARRPVQDPMYASRRPVHELARAAADLAERDDLWFAQAQWLVRRALLTRASELGIDPEDACWLPLDELAATTSIDLDSARRRAAGARAAATRAASWAMPVVVGGPEARSGPVLVGIGTGGRATGRVVRLASLASAIVVGHGDVVVTRAVTPALAVIVIGCAAIISETGGPLDHGAALARELGIPCIVGCRDAWSLLSDGMIVALDGDAVTVTRCLR